SRGISPYGSSLPIGFACGEYSIGLRFLHASAPALALGRNFASLNFALERNLSLREQSPDWIRLRRILNRASIPPRKRPRACSRSKFRFAQFCPREESLPTGAVSRLDSPAANTQSGFDSSTQAPPRLL